jgi:glycosyltransferase involved in cell wall biosynthesis
MQRYSADLIKYSPADKKYAITLGRSQFNLWWWLPYAAVKAFWVCVYWRPNIIHLTDVFLSPLFLPMARFFKIKIIATAHSLDVIWPRAIYQRLISWSLPRMDRVVAVSANAKKYCKARGVKDDNITVIPNGIIINETTRNKSALRNKYSLADSDFVILSVGRLVKRKNHVWFVDEVFPRLSGQARLIIAGRGPEEDRLRGAINKSTKKDNIRYLGEVADDIRDELYALADVFVMPNTSVLGDAEGFGIVALEAAGAGLPVIASKIEGIIDAVEDGVNGRLVEADNADVLIQTLNELIHNRDVLTKLSKSSIEYTKKKYSWHNLSVRYRDLYYDVLKMNE